MILTNIQRVLFCEKENCEPCRWRLTCELAITQIELRLKSVQTEERLKNGHYNYQCRTISSRSWLHRRVGHRSVRCFDNSTEKEAEIV